MYREVLCTALCSNSQDLARPESVSSCSKPVENVKRVVAVIGRAHLPGVLYALRTDKGELRTLFDHLVKYDRSEPLLGRPFGFLVLAAAGLALWAAVTLVRAVLSWVWEYLRQWYVQVVTGGPGAGAIAF